MTGPSLAELVAGTAKTEERRHTGLVIGAFDARSGEQAIVGTGHTRLPDGPAPAADTVFEIGSITKVFTGLLLALAVVRGEVTLDTPVRRLLPGEPVMPIKGGREITVEHLVTHRSGLPRSPVGLPTEARAAFRGTNPYEDVDPRRVIDVVSRTRLRRVPGTGRIAYSNLGAGLLGVALVAAAGAGTYGDLLRTRICTPLGMNDTTVLQEADRDRLATGHRSRGVPVDHWTLSGLAGAGALLSSANDMLTFLTAQLNPELTPLSEAIVLSQQPRHSTPRFGIALGWIMTNHRSGLPILWHNGGTGGFRSFAGFRPDRRTAAVLLTNSRRAPEPAALRLFTRL